MTDFILKCVVCRALLDEEDEFCVNCGTEAPCSAEQTHSRKTHLSTHNFACENCGASMSYDASVKNLHCPFCGSEKIHAEEDVKTLTPEKIVLFHINEGEALQALQKFMGGSFWRPSDLRQTSQVTQLKGIYVPYWVFAANTHTHWTADTSQTPPGAYASWYPLSGSHQATYEGILVGASGTLTPAETNAICPFDLDAAVPARDMEWDDLLYEPFRVQKKYARPQALAGFEEMERKACRQEVPASARNLRVAVKLDGLSSYPALLPVWILAYQYQGKTYRFLVNGQTGRSTGSAPFSYQKLGLVFVVSVAAVIALVLLVALCAGMMSARR